VVQTDPHAGGHDAHHDCHGPNAPTHHVNWYQGLLGVHNEKSQQGGVNKLLWRYNNPKDECDPKNQDPPLLGALINLAVVAFILMRFGKKPIMDALAHRKKTIMQDIDAAAALRADAEKRLKSYEKQLARIADRRKELQEEYSSQWEAERQRILKEAEEKASRLRRDAEFRVAQELKQAQADLLRESVDAAVASAEELLKSRVGAADHERLANDYLTNIGDALKTSGPGAARRTT
jgi:F-type H+-transporting ATPase subunit b